MSDAHPNSRYYRFPRPEMLPFIPAKRTRILDIGCGQGTFSAGIEGVEEAWGVEPSDAAQAAIQRLHTVIHNTFEGAKPQLPNRYFDVVVCNDVIEHMTDHDAFFESIKDHLAPGGVLVGSIPNVRHYVNLFDILLGRDWEYRDAGILDRTHLRFFTERSLRRAFVRHGYRIEIFEGINSGINWGDPDVLTRHKIFGTAMTVGSLGYFNDIRHLQFGFRVGLSA